MAKVDLLILFSIPVYIAVAAVTVIMILRYYTKKSKLPWMAAITLFITYWVLFSALSLVTIDLSSGLYAKTTVDPTDDNDPPIYLIRFWQFMYWAIQVLAWFGIPLWQSYWNGEFTPVRRILRSAMENAIMYGIMAVIGIVALGGLLTYIAISNARAGATGVKTKITFGLILGVGQSLSNAFGLLLLISLLGYGVVDLPRYLWQHANKARTLKFLEFQAVEMEETLDHRESELKEELTQVKSLNESVPEEHALRKYVDLTVKTCEKELNAFPRISYQRLSDEEVQALKRNDIVKLHKTVINAVNQYHRSEYQLKYLQDSYFFLQDVVESMDAKDRKIRTIYRRPRSGWRAKLLDYPEWLYYRYFRIIFYRLAAVFIALFALVLMYSEFTPFINTLQLYVSKSSKDISVLSLLVRWLAPARIALQLISLSIIVLIALIALFALFRIEIYSLYKLVPHHSDAGSILYTAVFLCRVVPTLCYNYLQLTGVSAKDGVAYYEVMGVLKFDGLKQLAGGASSHLLEIIGGGFTNYFPMLMIVIAFMTLFNVCGLLGSLFDIKRFQFNPKVDDATIAEGRGFLASARKLRQNELRDELAELDDDEINLEQTDFDNFELEEYNEDMDEDFDTGDRHFSRKTDKKLTDLYKKHGRERAAPKRESKFDLRSKLGF